MKMKIDRKIELFLLGIGVFIAVIALIPSFGQWLDPRTPSASPSPDEDVTTLPATPVPTATIDSDPTVYDNFNNPAFDGSWNTELWSVERGSIGTSAQVIQQDG